MTRHFPAPVHETKKPRPVLLDDDRGSIALAAGAYDFGKIAPAHFLVNTSMHFYVAHVHRLETRRRPISVAADHRGLEIKKMENHLWQHP